MKLGEFVVDLVVNAGQGELTVRNLVTSMGNLEVATFAQIGALWELATRLAAITDQSIKSAISLDLLSSKTGINTKEFQEWAAAGAKAGLAVEVVSHAFQALSAGMTQIRLNQPSGLLKTLQMLQIDPRGRTLPQLLDEIGKQLRNRFGKDQEMKVALLRQAGLPEDIIKLTDKTAKERAHDAEGAYIMTEKQIRKYEELHGALIDVRNSVANFGQYLSDNFADPLLVTLQTIVGTIKEIKKELSTGTGPAGAVGKTLGTFKSGAGEILKAAVTGGEEYQGTLGDFFRGFMQPSTKSEDQRLKNAVEAFGKSLEETGDKNPKLPIGGKTFNNIFNFPGIHNAEEAKQAARGVMRDQNNMTEYFTNIGAVA